MEFDEAIEEMKKASIEFKQAVETACAKLSERYTELTEKPAPPERKIDHPCLQGWQIVNGKVYDANGCDANQPIADGYHYMRADLTYHAPATMRDLIDWVNEWYSHGDAIDAPGWMKDGMLRLKQRVIDNGFECDLD